MLPTGNSSLCEELIGTVLTWLYVVCVGLFVFVAILGVLPRPRLKEKRAYRLSKGIVQFYAASYVKGRITKEDFFQPARRLLIKCKYHRLSKSRADRYIEDWTGFTPD